MNTIVELQGKELHTVIDLAKQYNGNFPRAFEFPSLMTLRLRNVRSKLGNVNADITFNANMRTKVMDIYYQSLGFAVSMEKRARPFSMKVRLGESFFDRVDFLELPMDRETFNWLISKTKNDFDGTNAEFIVFLCHCAGMALGAMPFAFDSTVTGDKIVYVAKPDFRTVATTGLERLKKESYLEKRLEGWDCINLTWEQFWKITEVVDEDSLGIEHLFLNRFAVKLDEEKNKENIFDYGLYFYDANPNAMTVDITFTESNRLEYNSETYRIGFWYDVNPITGERKLMWDFADPTKVDKEVYERFKDNTQTNCGWSTLDFIVRMFLFANHFMLNYKDVATDVEEKECKPSTLDSKKHNHNRRGAVRMFKQYTLKKNWKTHVNRKKAEIHCLAWGVRGHFRHYKSGKVVFVNAYVKGKERDKYQGKDYIIPPTEVI